MQAALLTKCKRNIVIHPRLAYQNLPTFDQDAVLHAFPIFLPFPDKDYHQLSVVIDWDHKLPSRKLFARVLAFHTPESFSMAQREIQARRQEIAPRNEWPEFDVHDFEDIPADESYLLHLNLEGEVRKVEFLSSWKNLFQDLDRERILQILERDPQYQEVLSTRKQSCGPARIVMWVPPCVSNQTTWTVDVRVLTFCDGPSFWGRFFLVDPLEGVVRHFGNFHVRS